MTTTLSGFTVSKPGSAPTATAGSVSGALDPSAVYQYKVTFVTGFGETDGNTSASSVTTSSTGSVNLTSIPVSVDPNVIQRKLYRTTGGGGSFLLLTTIDDNITTTYTDLIDDSALGSAIPTANTASSRQIVNGLLQMSSPMLYSVETSITAAAGGGQANAYKLTSEINNVTTVATTGDSIRLPELNSNSIGLHILVANNGANSLNVFPSSGQNASAGADTAVAVGAGARAEFVAVTSSSWIKTR